MSENPLLVPPRERVVEIYPGDIEAELESLNIKLGEALADDGKRPKRATDKSPALAIAEQYDALVEGTRDGAVKVTLRAVPHRAYRQLQEAHPPRKGNKRDEMYGVNEDSFFPALVRKAMVSPEITDEQFAEFMESCSTPAFQRLSQAAFDITTGDVALPKSSAVSALRRMRESGSEPQPDSE